MTRQVQLYGGLFLAHQSLGIALGLFGYLRPHLLERALHASGFTIACWIIVLASIAFAVHVVRRDLSRILVALSVYDVVGIGPMALGTIPPLMFILAYSALGFVGGIYVLALACRASVRRA